ncbi:MAG: hypothetical protein ACKOOC_07865 [Cyanobium sp.]
MARRTREQIANIRAAIFDYCEKYQPLTVRQLFYALVCQGLIDKSETEYKQTVGRLAKEMRLEGDLPWHWLVDNTRWIRKPSSYGSLADCVESSSRAYRRSLWQQSDEYVDVWLEKDALSGVLYDVTSEYDCPLMVTRGHPSLSFLREAAETMVATRKAVTVYYFGDYDPSGKDIARNCPERLRQFMEEISHDEWECSDPIRPFDGGPKLNFIEVAVNECQIDEWNLPTRETKGSDSRAAKFGSRSVELDAIPPDQLRAMVRACLDQHISRDELAAAEMADELERQTLAAVAQRLRVGAPL